MNLFIDDPVEHEIRAARLWLLPRNPEAAQFLVRQRLQHQTGTVGGIRIEGGALYYCREAIKRLTVAELTERLLAVAGNS